MKNVLPWQNNSYLPSFCWLCSLPRAVCAWEFPSGLPNFILNEVSFIYFCTFMWQTCSHRLFKALNFLLPALAISFLQEKAFLNTYEEDIFFFYVDNSSLYKKVNHLQALHIIDSRRWFVTVSVDGSTMVDICWCGVRHVCVLKSETKDSLFSLLAVCCWKRSPKLSGSWFVPFKVEIVIIFSYFTESLIKWQNNVCESTL